MAPVDVAALLNTAEKGAKDKLKSTDVAKEVDPVLDLGNLLGSDLQPIDVREFMWVFQPARGCVKFDETKCIIQGHLLQCQSAVLAFKNFKHDK